MRPSDFFRRNVVSSFQPSAFACPTLPSPACGGGKGGGVDNMMWGSDYPHGESTFAQSRKILAEIPEGVSKDEQTKPAPDHDPGITGGNTARVYNFEVAKLTVHT